PSRIVILGIAPRSAETSYGWIEPSVADPPSRPGLFKVQRFWEKPPQQAALRFWRRAFLWNSFVMVARVHRMLETIEAYVPTVFAAFERAHAAERSGTFHEGMDDMGCEIVPVGFSEGVLARCPGGLMVHRVDDVDWSDLGEPDRVLNTLRMIGHEPGWVKPFLFEQVMDLHYAPPGLRRAALYLR